MKSLETFFPLIENSDFTARFLLLSGFSSVLNLLEQDETIQELISFLKDNEVTHEKLANHISELVQQGNNPDFVQQGALLSYLFALKAVASHTLLELLLEAFVNVKLSLWLRKMLSRIATEDLQKSPLP